MESLLPAYLYQSQISDPYVYFVIGASGITSWRTRKPIQGIESLFRSTVMEFYQISKNVHLLALIRSAQQTRSRRAQYAMLLSLTWAILVWSETNSLPPIESAVWGRQACTPMDTQSWSLLCESSVNGFPKSKSISAHLNVKLTNIPVKIGSCGAAEYQWDGSFLSQWLQLMVRNTWMTTSYLVQNRNVANSMEWLKKWFECMNEISDTR